MILILTGPPAAGKNTLAHQIAKRLERGVVIDVDQVRAMVAQPHIAPWLGEAGMTQLRLGVKNGCTLAQNFVSAGYDVIILDVLTDATAAIYRMCLGSLAHQIVLLLPTMEESLRRNQQRGQWLTDDEVRLLYGWQSTLRSYDRKIDNSHWSATALADELVKAFLKK